MRIAILWFDGFDGLDAIGPVEVLRDAGFPTQLDRTAMREQEQLQEYQRGEVCRR